jgi:hypothetical protein
MDRALDCLTPIQIAERLARLSGAQYLTVLKTDGTTHQVPSESAESAPLGLLVRGKTSTGLISITLAANEIAQITPSEMVVSDEPIQRRLDQEMFLDLLASVESLGDGTESEVVRIPVAYAYDPTEPPRLGTIMSGKDMLIYADVPWFEMAHREGKSVSFGLSLFGFGGNAGFSWSKSLLDEIAKVSMGRKVKTTLQDVCRTKADEVSLADNVHLWTIDRLPTEDQAAYLISGEEGRDWRPAFITRSPNNPDKTNIDPHIVGYFATDGFLIGPEAWQMLPYPCRIFGQVVPQIIGTTFGSKECYVRIRAAAILGRDQETGFTPS